MGRRNKCFKDKSEENARRLGEKLSLEGEKQVSEGQKGRESQRFRRKIVLERTKQKVIRTDSHASVDSILKRRYNN